MLRAGVIQSDLNITDFPDGHRAVEPPDPIPNSEVKSSIADGSVVFRHVRVGHYQGFTNGPSITRAFLLYLNLFLNSTSFDSFNNFFFSSISYQLTITKGRLKYQP